MPMGFFVASGIDIVFVELSIALKEFVPAHWHHRVPNPEVNHHEELNPASLKTYWGSVAA
jgi:hypothetical protein